MLRMSSTGARAYQLASGSVSADRPAASWQHCATYYRLFPPAEHVPILERERR